MNPDNRLFDDMARVVSGAMGAMSGVRQEVESLFRARMDRWIADLDLVTREEFEAVRAMAARARAEQEDMAIRLAALETRLAAAEKAAMAPAPAAKKTKAAAQPRRMTQPKRAPKTPAKRPPKSPTPSE